MYVGTVTPLRWLLLFFFFSSRRRHTRCSRDWSSDVCSSDLKGEPSDVAVSLAADPGHRIDTLRFDAGGRAELRLPPGVYRYAASDGRGAERGVVAVETYSDEWRPAVPMLVPQSRTPGGRLTSVGLRDRWGLFVVGIAALVAEWAWRRREGLP